MEIKLFDKTGKETGKVKLNDRIFKQDVNKPLLWENITALLKTVLKIKLKSEAAGRNLIDKKVLAGHGPVQSVLLYGAVAE